MTHQANLQAVVANMAEDDRLRNATSPLKYKSPADFVAALGCSFLATQLTGAEGEIVEAAVKRARRVRPFAYKQCFVNSQTVLDHDESGQLKYIEGYVWLYDVLPPVLHGWLAVNGKIVDVTAVHADVNSKKPPREPRRILGTFHDRSYFGVSFLRRYVRTRASATRGWGSLIDDWQHGHPLLSEGGEVGAVMRRRC